MGWTYYAKVWYLFKDAGHSAELFITGNNYADAAKKIEDHFKGNLLAFKIHQTDYSEVIFVEDIEEHLAEGREFI